MYCMYSVRNRPLRTCTGDRKTRVWTGSHPSLELHASYESNTVIIILCERSCALLHTSHNHATVMRSSPHHHGQRVNLKKRVQRNTPVKSAPNNNTRITPQIHPGDLPSWTVEVPHCSARTVTLLFSLSFFLYF